MAIKIVILVLFALHYVSGRGEGQYVGNDRGSYIADNSGQYRDDSSGSYISYNSGQYMHQKEASVEHQFEISFKEGFEEDSGSIEASNFGQPEPPGPSVPVSLNPSIALALLG